MLQNFLLILCVFKVLERDGALFLNSCLNLVNCVINRFIVRLGSAIHINMSVKLIGHIFVSQMAKFFY